MNTKFIITRVSILIYILLFIFWSKLSISNYVEAGNRSADVSFLNKMHIYKSTIDLSEKIAFECNKKLSIANDPELFFIEKSDGYKVSISWGGFSAWNESTDLIVIGPTQLNSKKLPEFESIDINGVLANCKQNENKQCFGIECFKALKKFGDYGLILWREY
jgi:hypothetical protein